MFKRHNIFNDLQQIKKSVHVNVYIYIYIYILFFVLRRYKFLIYKLTNSSMNLFHILIKIDGC